VLVMPAKMTGLDMKNGIARHFKTPVDSFWLQFSDGRVMDHKLLCHYSSVACTVNFLSANSPKAPGTSKRKRPDRAAAHSPCGGSHCHFHGQGAERPQQEV